MCKVTKVTKGLKILWIDDEFQDRNSILQSWKTTLRQELSERLRMEVEVITWGNTVGSVELIGRGGFDALVLDLELEQEVPSTFAKDGVEILQRAADDLKRSPPAFIFSNWVKKDSAGELEGRFQEELSKYRRLFVDAFVKTTEEFKSLVEAIALFVDFPPIRMVLLSDVHAGFFDSTRSADYFFDGLYSALEKIQSAGDVDMLVCVGDLAWKNQREDLRVAAQIIKRMMSALSINDISGLALCPGNHDIDVIGHTGWSPFQEFIKDIAANNREIVSRYFASRAHGLFGGFHRKEDLFSYHELAEKKIVIIGFNAVNFKDHESGKIEDMVWGEVGLDQLHMLEKIENVTQSDVNKLKIALVHYPLFQVPGKFGEVEDSLIKDQARVLYYLAKNGIGLVINGHSHFSGITEYRVAPLNFVGEAAKAGIKKITNISVPTVGGDPHEGTPMRQFFVLSIGHLNRLSRKRTISIETWVHQAADNSWRPGTALDEGGFDLVQ